MINTGSKNRYENEIIPKLVFILIRKVHTEQWLENFLRNVSFLKINLKKIKEIAYRKKHESEHRGLNRFFTTHFHLK